MQIIDKFFFNSIDQFKANKNTMKNNNNSFTNKIGELASRNLKTRLENVSNTIESSPALKRVKASTGVPTLVKAFKDPFQSTLQINLNSFFIKK